MADRIAISGEDCIGCGVCVEMCPTTPNVFEMRDILAAIVHPEVCESCMLCIENCPTDALSMRESEDIFLDLGDID